jgi:membrane protein implicated in regulation of membrane protease activity
MRRNGRPPRRRRSRPYLDSALLYGTLAAIIVAVAGLTGGGIEKALLVAAVFFVGATAWSWWRVRQRLVRQARER